MSHTRKVKLDEQGELVLRSEFERELRLLRARNDALHTACRMLMKQLAKLKGDKDAYRNVSRKISQLAGKRPTA